MNELQMIRSLLAETPSGQTVAEGRERLERAVRTPGRARPKHRSGIRWTAGIGLVAASAAVAMTVALSGGTTPRAPDQAVAEQPLNARNVLLAAAQQAEAQPAKGAYWHVKTLHILPTQVGPKGRQYWVNKLQISETWTQASGRSWTGFREVGAKPRTAADAAAWKRDGSPTEWDLGPGDTVDQANIILRTTPRPGELFKPEAARDFNVCDAEVGFKRIQALPTESKPLKAKLLQMMRTEDGDGRIDGRYQHEFANGCLTSLLVDVPAPPKVRAAAYRALADQGGVSVLGRVKDEHGRPGVGLLIRRKGGYPEIRLVIDPKTSLVLSQKVGKQPVKSKDVTSVYLAAGWTDSPPKAPTLP